MKEVQRFCLENIYCAPSQDRQYRFRLIRITKPTYPASGTVKVYDRVRNLPEKFSEYNVYVLGAIPPVVLNLVRGRKQWERDEWVSVSEDMNVRNFMMQFYDCDGVMYPTNIFYYTIGRDNELIIAMKLIDGLKSGFDIEGCTFVRFYSNEYFTTPAFDSNTERGIRTISARVFNNQDIVNIQNTIASYESEGGKALIYINGLLSDRLRLSTPEGSFVDVIYDKSIIATSVLPISELRVFNSSKDERVKYLLYQDRVTEDIQYEDDVEVYVQTSSGSKRGLYYYQHKDFALSNVTDKDFAIDAIYLNNQANILDTKLEIPHPDKEVVIFHRKSSYQRSLVYSSLKLHELYKLPDELQLDVLNNVNHTLSELRVETLEDSDYFKVASLKKLNQLTPQLASDTLGYSAIKYYFGNTPVRRTDLAVEIPRIYRSNSLVYTYSKEGRYLGNQVSIGSYHYEEEGSDVKFLEFIQGKKLTEMKLYNTGDVISIDANREFRLYSAFYDLGKRLTDWEDVTDSEGFYKEGNDWTIVDPMLQRIRLVYLDDILTFDYTLSREAGNYLINLEVLDDKGDGPTLSRLDLPFDSIEVFLNQRRLTYKVDYHIQFPTILLCNKSYLNLDTDEQHVHIRLTGLGSEIANINKDEIRGFVSHGTLSRNNYYDIRDDKVFSIFVNGLLRDRSTITFSEDDNSVRLIHPFNGAPYTMTEKLVSLKSVTGVDTLPLYERDRDSNEKISSLFNDIFPEPEMNELMTVQQKHILYSPMLSKLIDDLANNRVPSSIYTNPYNDNTLNSFINDRYKLYNDLDPIHNNFPISLVEIHPHSGNSPVDLNLFQYRFVTNIVKLLTNGNPSRIDLASHLTLTTDVVDEVTGKEAPGGVTVLP